MFTLSKLKSGLLGQNEPSHLAVVGLAINMVSKQRIVSAILWTSFSRGVI